MIQLINQKDKGKVSMFGKKPQKFTCIHMVLACVALLVVSCAWADDIDDEIALKTAQVEELKVAIAEIDSEFLRCKQSKTLWTTATVVGGVGVVATGTAAAVQGAKIIKNKKEQKSKTADTEKK